MSEQQKRKANRTAFPLNHLHVKTKELTMVFFVSTWYVVSVGLDVSREAGVLGDRWAVVVQLGEFCGDICVAWHEDRRQNWRGRDAFFQDMLTDSKTAIMSSFTHWVSPPSGSGRG